jgi:NAD(P)H-nitrite reductase large subunit
MSSHKEFLIIGNGVAGVSAAERIKTLEPDTSVTIISKEKHPFYYRRNLAWYLAGRISKDQLIVKPHTFYEERGIEVITDTLVTSLDPINKQVESSRGKFRYTKLLIATGSNPFLLKMEGSELDGIYLLRTLDDAERISEELSNISDVAIIGGGLLGLNLAEAAVSRGKRATVIEIGERVCPQILDTVASSYIQAHMQEKGVVVKVGEAAKAFQGSGSVESVKTSQGAVIPCQMVLFAVGVRPSIGWLQGSGINTDRGVIVDEYLQSNMEGVYAAGDVAQAYDKVLGRHLINTSWANAEEQGSIAGENMAESPTKYGGSIKANVESVFGLPMVGMGVTHPEGSEYKVYVSGSDAQKKYKKIVVQDNLIVGAIIVGDVKEVDALQSLIKRGVDITGYLQKIETGDIDFRTLI